MKWVILNSPPFALPWLLWLILSARSCSGPGGWSLTQNALGRRQRHRLDRSPFYYNMKSNLPNWSHLWALRATCAVHGADCDYSITYSKGHHSGFNSHVSIRLQSKLADIITERVFLSVNKTCNLFSWPDFTIWLISLIFIEDFLTNWPSSFWLVMAGKAVTVSHAK